MKLLKELKETNSRSSKTYILKKASELEIKTLYYTYNPHLRFGITNGPTDYFIKEPKESMFDILDQLANREITGDIARDIVHKYARKNGNLIYLICRKDLGCGISTKIINKAIPNLIPFFNVQLAKEVPLEELNYPLVAQIKYDGVRLIAKIENGRCELLTRNAKVVNCPELSSILSKIKSDIILDGEITLLEGKSDERTSISGKVNSAIHGGELNLKGLVFNVFDCMKLKDFNVNYCIDRYDYRYNKISDYIDNLFSDNVRRVPNNKVYNVVKAKEYYEIVYDRGYEGIILKSMDHKYTFKRSKDWVKVKAVKSADLVCVGVDKGIKGTKYEKLIGSLVCEGRVLGKNVKVNVGSGLSDRQRNLNPICFLNRTVEIKYNSIIRNAKNDGWTLFLPRFVCTRCDK